MDYSGPSLFNKRTTAKLNRQKLFELKILDAKLGRGHVLYFVTILALIVAIVIDFLVNIEEVLPLPVEIYRIVLFGLFLFVLIQAIIALRKKKLYLQVLVVYYLKWYIVLVTVYSVIKLGLHSDLTAGVICGQLAQVLLILALIWEARHVREELKRREEILAEINFNSFFSA